MTEQKTSSTNRIPVLEKTLQVVEYISTHPGSVGQSELIQNLDIPQATCYRIINTLVAHKWLVKKSKNRYDIAPKMGNIAEKVNSQFEHYRQLQPALDNFSRKVGFSAKLSICEDDQQINVLSSKAPWDIAITAAVGMRGDIVNGGSSGAIFIAHSADFRRLQKECSAIMVKSIDFYKQNGYSKYNSISSSWQVDAISTPILNDGNDLIAVLTILAMPNGFKDTNIPHLVENMQKLSKLFAISY